jgi:ketosteroid isomerase-like protein
MKKLFYLLLCIFAFSCGEKKNIANELASENIKVVENMFQAFNDHKWAEMASYYSDTAEFKDPSFGVNAIMQTQKEVANKYIELNAMLPDIHDEIINIYTSGDKNVIVEFASSGTMPDGNKMYLPICTIFTVENGKITKDYTYYDAE